MTQTVVIGIMEELVTITIVTVMMIFIDRITRREQKTIITTTKQP